MNMMLNNKIIRSGAVLICLLFLNRIHAHAQKLIKNYVDEKSVAIKNIDPDSVNYDDLEPIGNAIGNCRVVMLGEQDHGDAPAFLAKTRLIKYLHEKKGFDVLAFESDFFGLNYGWDNLEKTPKEMNYFILQNIFGIWTTCNACTNLFYQYIPASYKTTSPLMLTGFDSQQYLDYSFHNLKDKLDSVLRSKNLPITHEANYQEALRLIDSSKKWDFIPPTNASHIAACVNYLQSIKNQLGASVNADDFWMLVIDNLIQQVSGVKYKLGTGKQASDERDIQMAKNLRWLIEHKYKDKKIIVWAASRHIARSLKNLTDHQLRSAEAMGDQLVTILPENEPVYVLGFTSFQGTGGRIGADPYKVYTRFKNSFEGWLNEKNYKYAFVDFSGYNKLYADADENFKMAALGHSTIDGKWNRVFDGIFYIKDTYACTRMEKYPVVK